MFCGFQKSIFTTISLKCGYKMMENFDTSNNLTSKQFFHEIKQ